MTTMFAKIFHPGLIKDPEASKAQYWTTVITLNVFASIGAAWLGRKLGEG